MTNNSDSLQGNMDAISLSGEFAMHHSSKKRFRIDLSKHCISFSELENKGSNTLIVKKQDILGCDCLKGRKKNDSSSYLSLYCYQHKKKVIGDSTLRQRRVLTIVFNGKSTYEENNNDSIVWKTKISEMVKGLSSDEGGEC